MEVGCPVLKARKIKQSSPHFLTPSSSSGSKHSNRYCCSKNFNFLTLLNFRELVFYYVFKLLELNVAEGVLILYREKFFIDISCGFPFIRRI